MSEKKSTDLGKAVDAVVNALKGFDPITSEQAVKIAAMTFEHESRLERAHTMEGINGVFGGMVGLDVNQLGEMIRNGVTAEEAPYGPNVVVQGDFKKNSGALSPEEIEKL